MSETSATPKTGAATGGVRLVLRLEGVVLFAGMTLLYGLWDGSWWVYAILFLAPDVSFAAYVFGPKTGAAVSRYRIGSDGLLNHQIEITSGVLAEECATLLREFFHQRRENGRSP